jgi:hypothetical protein
MSSDDQDPLNWWGPCLHTMGAIIDSLDAPTQKRVCEKLRLLAIVQEDKKLHLDSYFSRALSGELAPPAGQIAQPISIEERVEAQLTKDFDFQDYLQPRGLLSAALKPTKRGDA